MKTAVLTVVASASFFLTAAALLGPAGLSRAVTGGLGGMLDGAPAYLSGTLVGLAATCLLTRALAFRASAVRVASALLIWNVIAAIVATELVGEATISDLPLVYVVITGLGLQILAGAAGAWLGARWTQRSEAV